jgi:hypothetical protein
MKIIITALLFSLIIIIQAQSQKTKKDIYSILEAYEKAVTPYLEEKMNKEISSSLTQESKDEAIARRMALSSTLEGISKETRAKFKDEQWNILNIKVVKDFIEYRYRLSVSGLPDEFYKKVSTEVDKL